MSEFAFLGTETAAEWESWRLDNAVVDDGAVRLRAERLPAYVDPRTLMDLASDEVPLVAIDVDDCGDLYLLRADGVLARYDADRDRLERFECAGVDLSDGEGRDLLVTPETIFVAQAVAAPGGTSGGADGSSGGRLVALSRHLRQTRWVVADPDAVPVALADHDDVVYALVATDGDGHLARVGPDGDRRPVLTGLTAPRGVAFDDAGGGYVLDEDVGGSPIVRRVESDALDPDSPLSAPSAWGPPVPTGAACMAAGRENELLVGCSDVPGGAATLFRVEADERDPLAGIEWGITDLHHAGDLYALDAAGSTVWRLDARGRYIRDETTDGYDARLTRSFDSGEFGVQWHRVTMGFDVDDPGTQVRLKYAASDDPLDTGDVDWQDLEPANPHDALLPGAEGRYLWLQVELRGDRYATPTLRTLRAYFPRQSYLRHLPAVYQDDADSRAFLERYLSIFESTFAGVAEDLDGVTRYFDPNGVPPEYLGWLERWLALEMDETWPDRARRDLIDAAPDLFRERGTVDGLLDLLDVYLSHVADPSPAWEARIDRQLDSVDDRVADGLSPADARPLRRRIESPSYLLEYADLDCASGPAREPYERLLDCPQCFFVFVRPFVDDEQFQTIQTLVDDHRPAHAVGQAVELTPSILLGGHSYLGINSVLPERDLVVGTGELGRDSVLAERESFGQLDVRARLGEDTTLS